jgi:hypothetical protein
VWCRNNRRALRVGRASFCARPYEATDYRRDEAWHDRTETGHQAQPQGGDPMIIHAVDHS